MTTRQRIVAGWLLVAASPVLAQSPVEVTVVEETGIVETLRFSGTVTTPRRAELSTSVAGLVATVVRDIGAEVAAGEPLIELDAELARLALERVRAERSRSATDLADAGRRLADAEKIGASRAIARTEIESLRAEVDSDTAALAAAEAALREQQAIYDRHVVRAPFAGVISERTAEAGEWVNPGDTLLELVAVSDVQFDFRVAQEYFRSLRTGMAISIGIDALPDMVLDGVIAAIVPVSSASARTFLVRARTGLDQAAGITPGMSVSGAVRVDTGRVAAVVSRDALLRFPDGRTTVWVVDVSGERPVVREQIVTTGLEFGNRVEIRNGLENGDRVVVRGNEALTAGQPVSVVTGGG